MEEKEGGKMHMGKLSQSRTAQQLMGSHSQVHRDPKAVSLNIKYKMHMFERIFFGRLRLDETAAMPDVGSGFVLQLSESR